VRKKVYGILLITAALTILLLTLQHLDKTEHLDLIVVPLERAVDMVMNNEIHCNSSAHAILRAARIIGV
jgi:hypothetical protein